MQDIEKREPFDQIKLAVPEELKAMLEAEIIACRQRIEECAAQMEQMQPKPRDFSALEGGDHGLYWDHKHEFYDGVNQIEKDVLAELFTKLERNPAEVRTLDLGIGTGRSCRLALETLSEMGKDDETIKAYAEGIYGIELDEGNLGLSRRNLGPLGVSAGNIRQGNFIQPLPEDMRGQFNVVWMMMNGMTYANTEDRAIATIQNIEEALAPGGVFLFDMVQLDSLTDDPDEETLKNYWDLMNFHSNLARMYNTEHEDAFGQRQALRFHVTGSTAVMGSPEKDQTRHPDNGMIIGNGAYTREIYTREYFDHILQKADVSLKPIHKKTVERVLPPIHHRHASAIGIRWMQQNGMEPYLRAEIAHRIALQGKGEKLTPLYPAPHIFSDPKASENLGLDLNSEEVDLLLENYVAPGMVNSYTKEYRFYRKMA